MRTLNRASPAPAVGEAPVRRRRIGGVGPAPALLAILALGIAHTWLYYPYAVDDVFISLTYVKNAAAGHGLTYNGGLVVEGYSNFLWVVLLVPLALAHLELVAAAKLVGLLLNAITLLLTWRLARRLLPPWPSLLPPLLVAASPVVALWDSSGLETALFTCLVTLAVWLELRAEAGGVRALASAPAFALAAMTRPEGAVFFGVALLYRLCRLAFGRARGADEAVSPVEAWEPRAAAEVGGIAGRRKPAPAHWRDLAAWIALFGAITLPYWLWRWSYYGYPLPNTVYVKATGNLTRQAFKGLLYLYQFANSAGYFLLLLAPLAMLRSFGPRARFLAGCLGLYTLFIVLAGGDWMPLARFFVPVFPLAAVLLVRSLTALSPSAVGSGRALGPAIALGIVGLSLAWSFDTLYISQTLTRQYAFAPGGWTRPPAWVAWVRDHARPGDTVAVVDAGAIGYFTDVRVLDMIGLLDTHIAHLPARFPPQPWDPARGYGFGKWDVDYVLASEPRFVQMHVDRAALEAGRLETDAVGTTLLLNDPRFAERYVYVDAPGVTGLFQARDRLASGEAPPGR